MKILDNKEQKPRNLHINKTRREAPCMVGTICIVGARKGKLDFIPRLCNQKQVF